MPTRYLSNMNLKKIIREEMDDMEWIINTDPLQKKKWFIVNDNSESDPYMKEVQKILFGLGWRQKRWKNQDLIPSDRYEEEQLFHSSYRHNFISFIYPENLEDKIFDIKIGSDEWDEDALALLKYSVRESHDIYLYSDFIKGNLE
jgi:hypothetical protein